MIPEVSAGSNQVGASVTCTAQVSWPSGPAARAQRAPLGTAAMARMATIKWRTRRDRFALPKKFPPKERDSIARLRFMPPRPGKFAGEPFRHVGLLAPKRPSLLYRLGTCPGLAQVWPSAGPGLTRADQGLIRQTSVGPARFGSSNS